MSPLRKVVFTSIRCSFQPMDVANGNNHTDGSVSGNKRKCLIIIYSLHLRESNSHKYHFVLVDTSINCMFDLIYPLGSHYKIPLWSRNNIPHIILHDGMILLGHGILPKILTCCFSMTRRLSINDVVHG
jgi:hypothetical protein